MIPQSSWWENNGGYKCHIVYTQKTEMCDSRGTKHSNVTSVESGGVVSVRSDERRLRLSANGVVPHPSDATLQQKHGGVLKDAHTHTHRWHIGEVTRAAAHLSISSGSATLAACVAAVGAKGGTFHWVWRAGRGRCAALGEMQASPVILLTLRTKTKPRGRGLRI